MPTSISDTINLAASGVTIAGGLATLIGFIRKMFARSSPSAAPPPTYGYQQPQSSNYQQPPLQRYQQPPAPGYQPQPPAPGAQQAQWAPPAYAPPAPTRARRIPHPVIWGFAALGVICVVGYFLVLLYQYFQTGSTSIASGSPLYILNILLYAGDFIGGLGAVIGLLVSSTRSGEWLWLAFAVFGLGVVILTVGIMSIIALVPAAFYALFSAPSPPRAALASRS
jgi:hypothetical protein